LVRETMYFCPHCQTYLANADTCPACGQARPAAAAVEPRWALELHATPHGYNALVAWGEMVFIAAVEDERDLRHSLLLAVDSTGPAVRWRCHLENALISDPVAVAGGILFLGTRSTDRLRSEGLIMALEAATGRERWQVAPGAQTVSALTVTDGILFATLDGDILGAWDVASGKARWRVKLPVPRSIAAPTAAGDTVYLPSRGPHLTAVARSDGAIRWVFHAPLEDRATWLLASPAVVGEHVFAVSTGGAVFAIAAVSGELLWRRVPGQAGKALTAPVCDGPRLYVGSVDHHLYALDAATGQGLWAFETGRRITGRPLVRDGVVYVTAHDHHLYALDAVSGTELWRVETRRRIESSPVVSGELVLAVDHGGRLIAVERVLSAEAYAAQGRWEEAAGAYIRRGELPTAACIYQEQLEQPLRAAELWKAAGNLEQAAVLYEQAERYDLAEICYRELGQSLKVAEMAARQGAYDRAARLFEELGAWAEARRCYEHLGDRRKVAELSEKVGEWEQAGQEWEALGELPRAARAYRQVGNWAEAARLYEQMEAWSQAAECHEKAGNWEQVGHIQRRLGNFAAAARAFIQAARHLEQTAPHDEARLAKLWATAETCCREAFDEAQAEECCRQVACYRRLPYIEVNVMPPQTMVRGRYAFLEFILCNTGGGPARQIVVHHTPSEFMGELSQTREIRGLHPGQELSQSLSVRPLASGPVPLVIAVDYADAAGHVYQTTYRTYVTVLEPDELPTRRPAARPEATAMAATFADFDLLIGQRSGDVYPVYVHSPAGEARGAFRLPFSLDELARAWQRLEKDEADIDFLQDFGSRLFTALFQGDVGSRFRSSQGMTAQGSGLRLRLRVEPGELIILPWELLYDPERREFLGLTGRTPIVRHLPVPRPTMVSPIPPPLRMLVVAASPRDLPPLDIQRELKALRQAVQPLVDEEVLILDILRPATTQALQEHLQNCPCHILHFIGHGGFDGREGYITLEDTEGWAMPLDARRLKILLGNSPVRLAVLNACLTARDAVRESPSVPERAYLGVAPALVDAGLLAVVAMQFSLSDKGAWAFARDFYRMLARRRPVNEAVDRARVKMVMELGLECRDWAAPVLFLRGSAEEIFP